jgi:mRNA interferase MazF
VRGDVYRLKKPRSAQGPEQQGERYAVVVQANAYEHLSTWLVAPTTTKSFGSLIHPTIEIFGQDVRVLVEQTTAVNPQRLGDFAGRLNPEELMGVNVALRPYSTSNNRYPQQQRGDQLSMARARRVQADQVARCRAPPSQ